MAQLRQGYQNFIDENTEILVIGPESKSKFAAYWHKEQLPFIGLPDPEHKVANLYGQQVKLLKLGRLPALVVVDKGGRMRYQHHGNSMRDIVPNSEILTLLAQLNKEDN
jgi:peroxiredoxin Q/BCP